MKKNKKKKGGNKIKKIFKNFNIFSWLACLLIFLSICIVFYLLFIARKIYINQPLINGSRSFKILFRPFPYASVIILTLTLFGGIYLLIKSFKI